MPRPTAKFELLAAADVQFRKMWLMIDGISVAEQAANFSFDLKERDKEAHWTRDKNLRDVLVHLYEWHQLVLSWVKSNRDSDAVVPFLPAPYSWKSYGGMNIGFWEKHQSTSLEDAKQLLLQSHKDIIGLIESFSDEELFTKAFFPWSGTTSIGAYCISSTSSHYDWAMKKLKRQIGSNKN